MQKLRVHSKVLGLLSAHLLRHDLIFLNPVAAMQSCTSVPPLQHLTLPSHSGHDTIIRKMSERTDNDDSCNDNSSGRQPSTIEDLNILTILLKELVESRSPGPRDTIPEAGDIFQSTGQIEYKPKISVIPPQKSSMLEEVLQSPPKSKLRTLCGTYQYMLPQHKHDFIRTLARDYAVNHEKVLTAARALSEADSCNLAKVSKNEEALRHSLTPVYTWLFKHIGRLENGVKFIVDFRTDVLSCLADTDSHSPDGVPLQQLNSSLRDLLHLWFSIGFLKLERVTWESSCDMLQKISEYEAVHPVRSWADIKRRVGPYRRCFVFLHSSMPKEPLVVLHTALCDDIPASLAGIVNSRSRMSVDGQRSFLNAPCEDTSSVNSAIFYSITSTQRGLQGIDLGNDLIKSVVQSLQAEFPQMAKFSTLSPIPGFKLWLLDRIKSAEKGKNELLTSEEMDILAARFEGEVWPGLRRVVKTNCWVDSATLAEALRTPILRACARYLYLEKRRGSALCAVGNFHLSNGAVLWRINWGADLSLRGMTNSCGIMVNYRYFLEDTEANTQQYLTGHVMAVSDEVRQLAASAEALCLQARM